jgi:hypothetical protein
VRTWVQELCGPLVTRVVNANRRNVTHSRESIRTANEISLAPGRLRALVVRQRHEKGESRCGPNAAGDQQRGARLEIANSQPRRDAELIITRANRRARYAASMPPSMRVFVFSESLAQRFNRNRILAPQSFSFGERYWDRTSDPCCVAADVPYYVVPVLMPVPCE